MAVLYETRRPVTGLLRHRHARGGPAARSAARVRLAARPPAARRRGRARPHCSTSPASAAWRSSGSSASSDVGDRTVRSTTAASCSSVWPSSPRSPPWPHPAPRSPVCWASLRCAGSGALVRDLPVALAGLLPHPAGSTWTGPRTRRCSGASPSRSAWPSCRTGSSSSRSATGPSAAASPPSAPCPPASAGSASAWRPVPAPSACCSSAPWVRPSPSPASTTTSSTASRPASRP